MKTISTSMWVALAVVSAAWLGGCAEEVSRESETKRTWTGDVKHEEERVYRNPDGTYTTVKQKSVQDR